MSEDTPPQKPETWIYIAVASISGNVIATLFILFYIPAEFPGQEWLVYVMVGVLWASEMLVLYIFYDKYKKAGGTFGTHGGRRPDLGSQRRNRK